LTLSLGALPSLKQGLAILLQSFRHPQYAHDFEQVPYAARKSVSSFVKWVRDLLAAKVPVMTFPSLSSSSALYTNGLSLRQRAQTVHDQKEFICLPL
jgi:hypothetical protein